MSVRKIVNIDQEKCNGCGACANACHEGAIAMINNKAFLIKDDYCDGLGDCLPACPTGAITIIEREAADYDEEAVKNKNSKNHFSGCPGAGAKILNNFAKTASAPAVSSKSRLLQWPVQIKLVPVNAPYFNNSDLLIAADCSAYSFADFHETFIKGKIAIIGCPKLDDTDYSDKLGEILKNNSVKSITVVRMEVPCCGGIVNAVKKALEKSNKNIPLEIFTVSIDGEIK